MRPTTTLAIFLVFSALLFGQATKDSKPTDSDPKLTPGSQRTQKPRSYERTVVVWLIVDPEGKPHDVKVVKGLSREADKKALDAIREWKFEPALKDGKPVAAQINVEIKFACAEPKGKCDLVDLDHSNP